MAAKKPNSEARLEPADVLQTRMEYYNRLAKAEMKKGALGSAEKINDYLKLAQDAASELAPYRIAKAQAGEGDETKRQYVARIGHCEFQNAEEWDFYYRMIAAKYEHDLTLSAAGKSLNDRMLSKDTWIDNEKEKIQDWWKRVRADPSSMN